MKKILAVIVSAIAAVTLAAPAHADATDRALAYQVGRTAWRTLGPEDQAILCQSWRDMPTVTVSAMADVLFDAMEYTVSYRDARYAARRLMARSC